MANENVSAEARQHQSIDFDQIGTDLTAIIKRLATTNDALGKNTIVCICGGSCTGKSTQVSLSLKSRLGDEAQVLSQDNYMFSAVDALDPVYTWDHPVLYNLRESAQVMDLLRHHQVCQMPQSSARRQAAHVDIHPTRIILFEGLYAALDFLPDHADFVIYVEMPLYARIIRRLIRNMYERYHNIEPLPILESFLGSPLRAHQDFVRQQKNHADAVVVMDYCFKETINRFNLVPVGKSDLPGGFTERYQFTVAKNLVFEIRKFSDDYYFRIVYQADVYLAFRIREGLFVKLLSCDLHEC